MTNTETELKLVAQLGELYQTERLLLKDLPRMVRAACAKQLKWDLLSYFKITHQHLTQLDDIFESIGVAATGHANEAAKAVLRVARLSATSQSQGDRRDVGLLSAVQGLLQFETTAYRALMALSLAAGHSSIGLRLKTTLAQLQGAQQLAAQMLRRIVARSRNDHTLQKGLTNARSVEGGADTKRAGSRIARGPTANSAVAAGFSCALRDHGAIACHGD